MVPPISLVGTSSSTSTTTTTTTGTTTTTTMTTTEAIVDQVVETDSPVLISVHSLWGYALFIPIFVFYFKYLFCRKVEKPKNSSFLDLVNTERAEEGLKPLTESSEADKGETNYLFPRFYEEITV